MIKSRTQFEARKVAGLAMYKHFVSFKVSLSIQFIQS